MLKPLEQFLWISIVILSVTCFYIICGKEIPKTRMNFFQNTMNFESGFCNFKNIFFTIAGNIYMNRR